MKPLNFQRIFKNKYKNKIIFYKLYKHILYIVYYMNTANQLTIFVLFLIGLLLFVNVSKNYYLKIM